jgi:hypothetical protein
MEGAMAKYREGDIVWKCNEDFLDGQMNCNFVEKLEIVSEAEVDEFGIIVYQAHRIDDPKGRYFVPFASREDELFETESDAWLHIFSCMNRVEIDLKTHLNIFFNALISAHRQLAKENKK